MSRLMQEMCANGLVLTDGAWGTQLQVRGLLVGEYPEIWNLLRPDYVEAVAHAYVEAGSQVILTNTFGANSLTLARHDLADRTAEINRKGVEISRCAANGQAKVFALMGPTGQVLGRGVVSQAQVFFAFREQAEAAARTTGLPVIAGMVYGAGRNGDRTIMGVTPEQAAERLAAAGADGIG